MYIENWWAKFNAVIFGLELLIIAHWKIYRWNDNIKYQGKLEKTSSQSFRIKSKKTIDNKNNILHSINE